MAYARSNNKSGSSTPLTKASANPKAQPRSATSTKATNGAGKKAANKAKKRGKTATRSKPKTAEELDAEMTDYFTNNNGGATTNMTDANGPTNGNAQPATAGGEDLGMDEISVSSSVEFIT